MDKAPIPPIKSHIANYIVSRKKRRKSNSVSNGTFQEEAAAELHLCSIQTFVPSALLTTSEREGHRQPKHTQMSLKLVTNQEIPA